MSDNYGRMIDLFRKFDADQSGRLSYDEFFQGMKELGEQGRFDFLKRGAIIRHKSNETLFLCPQHTATDY